MQNLIKTKGKWYILLIILSPLIMMMLNLLVVTLFNTGTYIGTFFRYLYHIVVC